MDITSIVITIVAVVIVLGTTFFVLIRGQNSTPINRSTPSNLDALIGSDSELYTLLEQGNKIAAIKRVRELTGVGLREAKDYVDTRIMSHSLPEQHVRVTSRENLSSDSELQTLLARGNKLAAIKRVRELTGMGLREAKEYVDSL